MTAASRLRRLAHRALAAGFTTVLAGLLGAGPVLACAGLVTPGGNVKLVRTATLAAWADGHEHYVTSFTFEGGGAEFGSIVPLPGIPSKVERGGDWTLQRLERETQPKATPTRAASDEQVAASAPAEEVYNTRIDALDITILKGGGQAVGDWARDHGFALTPDAPEVLDFYAERSPIFMAARFNADAARERGQEQGEGTPIHLTIPLDHPWVPLRILGLGRPAAEQIDADVYLLTPEKPALLPGPNDGLIQLRSEAASKSLLDDLRSDKGMEWVPQSMWLTYLRVAEQAEDLRYDLAMHTSEHGRPSAVMAGLERPAVPATTTTSATTPPSTAAPTTTSTRAAKPAPPVSPTTAAPVPPSTVPPLVEQPPAVDPVPDGVALSAESSPDQREAVAVLPARKSGRGGGPAAVTAALAGAGLGGGLVAGALHLRRRKAGGNV
jgi:hypothetical protein